MFAKNHTDREYKCVLRTASSLGALIVAAMILPLGAARAADSDAASSAASDDGNAAEIVVTGSRRAARSPSDVPAPVDILSAAEVSQQASNDVSNLLRVSVPSLNVNDNSISGTSAAIRPVTLRGLSPDHTLVLVNGKRQHRSADIPTFSGGISDGSQSPDISSIPAMALKQVQVLRDGAAAQYGADAIAGVINFIMDDSPTGNTIQAKYGSTYKGDGDEIQVGASLGTRLGSDGFVRLTAEYASRDRTVRSVQRGDAQALIDAGYKGVPTPATRFGQPQIRNDFKGFLNFKTENGLGGELYGFGGYARKDVLIDFFYRNPTDRDAVFTRNGNYLVGDMTPGDGVTCDGGIDFATGTIPNPIAVGSANALARLAALGPNCFSANNLYPGGYSPHFGNKVRDIYGTIGTRGELIDDLTYDISLGAGRHKMSIYVEGSLNPSLGSLTPTDFDFNGGRTQNEVVGNIDLSYPLEVGFATPVNMAGGFEYHREKFTVTAGQPESYEAGILATQGFQIGEDAYAGYSPQIAGSWARHNISLYLDLETNPIEALDVGAAVRYEDYSDFGSKVTYKLSGLYHITDALGVRSTYATGFHAPSPGQQHYTGLGQELQADGTLVQAGVIPSTDPIALAVGGEALKPETSKSFSAGFVFDEPWLNLTIDYFNIKMKNRLTQSATYSLTDAQRDNLIAQGYVFASQIGTFRFFTNDFSSTTEGVDVVATVPVKLFPSGRSSFSLAGNYTKNKVTSYDPTDPNELLSAARVIQLEKNLPRYRGNVQFSHNGDRFHAYARANYYGKYTELHVNSAGLRIDAGSEITVDAEVGYELFEGFDISVGAMNLLNNFPDKNPYASILGSKYPTTSPMGANGGSYYIRAQFKF